MAAEKAGPCGAGSKPVIGTFTVGLVITGMIIDAPEPREGGQKNLRIFLSSAGSLMTVVLFQLFGLPCLFCARLCRSCLDDLTQPTRAWRSGCELGSSASLDSVRAALLVAV